MRSGVIAQKVGMTRVFTEAGEHIPVTVLKLGNCQVIGHRTTEKNGYVALQLGSGARKTVYMPKAERGQFAVAGRSSWPSASLQQRSSACRKTR